MKKMIAYVSIIAVGVFVGGFIFFNSLRVTSNKQTQENLAQAKKIYDAIPIWHKKIQTQQDLKIGIITDTHVHPTRVNRTDKRDDAPRQLKNKDVTPIRNFVADMRVFQPEFTVHLGDVIEGTGDEDFVGMKGLELVKEEIEKTTFPAYWVIGNHDLRSVTREQFKKSLNLESINQSFDAGDYRFIILDANYNKHDLPRSPKGNSYIRGNIPQQQIEWFKKQLETNKRVFVFMHHGVFQNDTPGDLKDDGEARMKQSIKNADDLQDIFKEYRVDGLFNGHMEARRYEKISNTNIYSMTGTKKSQLYPRSYYELSIIDGNPDVTMYYTPVGSTKIKKIDFENGEK